MALLDGRVVLVSGSGPGLGREVAAAALREGAHVALSDAAVEPLRRLCLDLDPDGARSLAIPGDITSEEDCQRVVEGIGARFGRLDGVVNVAAWDTAVGGLLDSEAEDWERATRVNVHGALRVIKSTAGLLAKSGSGSVVVIGSTSAVRPRRSTLRLAYGASKAALHGACHYLAEELGGSGIRVNVVAPGFKWGVTVQNYFEQLAAERGCTVDEVADPFRAELALGRFATDVDVANAVVFFLSDLAHSVTGQTLYVDGGFVMP